MNFKNMKRDEDCVTAESKLAGEFLERTIDHYDDIPEDMRVIVIVASGDCKSRIGCAFEGYDSDERLALDLQMLSQAVDLGVTPATEPDGAAAARLAATVDAHVEATRKHNAERAQLLGDLDGARAELRREQDARAQLRVEIDRVKAQIESGIQWRVSAVAHLRTWSGLFDAAVALRESHEGCLADPACGECVSCRFDAAVDEAMKAVAANSPGSVVDEVVIREELFEEGVWRSCTGCHESDEGHAVGPYSATFRCNLGSGCHECGGLGAIWEYYGELKCCPRFSWGDGTHDLDCKEAAPCCPQSTLPGSSHDIACRGGGKVH